MKLLGTDTKLLPEFSESTRRRLLELEHRTPAKLVDCYIVKRDPRDVLGPDEGIGRLEAYGIVPIEMLRHPLRRARIVFDLVCPGVEPDARNRTPQQEYYQALVDGGMLELKALEALAGGRAAVSKSFAERHREEQRRNQRNADALGRAAVQLGPAERKGLKP